MAEVGPTHNQSQPIIGAHRKPEPKRELVFTSDSAQHHAQKFIGRDPEIPWLTAVPGMVQQRLFTLGKREVTQQPSSLSRQAKGMQQVANNCLNLGNHL